MVCRNPALAEERARNREQLLRATERELDKLVEAVGSGRLLHAPVIVERVSRVLRRHKVGKHFLREIADGHFSYRRNQARIEEEAALDGIYVVRSNVSSQTLTSKALVRG